MPARRGDRLTNSYNHHRSGRRVNPILPWERAENGTPFFSSIASRLMMPLPHHLVEESVCLPSRRMIVISSLSALHRVSIQLLSRPTTNRQVFTPFSTLTQNAGHFSSIRSTICKREKLSFTLCPLFFSPTVVPPQSLLFLYREMSFF